MSVLRILGCSGGIGGPCRTTAFLLDGTTLIDAGTGVADLSLAEMAAIDHVFLTHAHLDHIASLPLMADAVGALRREPIRVYALPASLAALQQHVLNNVIWPDFTQIRIKDFPVLVLCPINMGESIALPSGETITTLPATHAVPACGYAITSAQGCLVFTGDTWSNDQFWAEVNALPHLNHVIVETSFPNALSGVADASKHLTPETLARELTKLRHAPKVYVTHLKPGMEETLMQEISTATAPATLFKLTAGDKITF